MQETKSMQMEGYISMFLFSYSTSHLLKKDKIRFYYALKGRDGKTGMVKFTSSRQLGRAVLLVEDKFKDEIERFLNYWKCTFVAKNIWLKKTSQDRQHGQ